MLKEITRLSGKFLFTAWGLLRHPWKVVSDYIKGRRVGLVSPVSMLLLLALYWGIAVALVPNLGNEEQIKATNMGAVFKWLYGSVTFQYLFLAIPVALGTWAVYYRDMRGRYNFAELLVATLYLACTFLLVNFVLMPAVLFNEEVTTVLIMAVTVVYGIISILRAFPQKYTALTVIKLAIWFTVCGLMVLFSLVLLAFPMYKDYL